MQQITKTVEQFLSFIVAVGLICFTSFVFLLASAQLNDSKLGELLALLAGETARTARTESFSYWGRVGNEVADGLGYQGEIFPGGGAGSGTGTGSTSPTSTPAANATTVAVRPTPLATPNATRVAVNAENVLFAWRGVNAAGTLLPLGVDLPQVSQQAQAVLAVDPYNPLATWVLKHAQACLPDYETLTLSNYKDPAQAQTIIAAADNLINACNPRLYKAYAYKRWAELGAWMLQLPATGNEASTKLQGLTVKIYEKTGPARLKRAEDVVTVEVQGIESLGLDFLTLKLPVTALNQLFGEGKWEVNTGPILVPGTLYPTDPPEPVRPTEEELSVPTPAVTPTASAGVGTFTVTGAGGTYVVQPGDTANSIAKKFNISLDALIAANPTTLGYNVNYIVVGQELIIPAATP